MAAHDPRVPTVLVDPAGPAGAQVVGADVRGAAAALAAHLFDLGHRDLASARGVPAGAGATTLMVADGVLTATTEADGVPVIRTTATVGEGIAAVGRGQLRYVTDVHGTLTSGLYPFHAPLAEGWGVTSLEFLQPDHPVSALRPADPLQVTWGFYSPAASFCYPGGEGPLATQP
jgi:hypothetical protein